jgi:hypothetical protein
MLLVVKRPGINALYVPEIISDNIGLSLLARILEINLYKTLPRLIGLNFETLSGLLVLGIRAKKVALSLLSRVPCSKKRVTASHTSLCTVLNYSSRNKRENHMDQGL